MQKTYKIIPILAVILLVFSINSIAFTQCSTKKTVVLGTGWTALYDACDKNVVKNTFSFLIAESGHYPLATTELNVSGTPYQREFLARGI